MRRESLIPNDVQIEGVQSYHGSHFNTETYAFEGFQSNKYFTSDRFIRLLAGMLRPDGKPLQGYGIEMELESWGVISDAALAELLKKVILSLFPDDLFKLQHDGSLGITEFDENTGRSRVVAVGVECITQVMTKQFIRNHYKDFKTMYNEYFPAFRISASESKHCGMHINISNALFGKTVEEQKEAIRKLYYIVNSNYEFACALFNRPSDCTGYCSRMRLPRNMRTMEIEGGDHYSCLNFSHFHVGRIELRLVGGQSDFGCFRNTMESVFWLVERVRRIKWEDCSDLVKIFTGCNQYVFDRLNTKCRAYLTEEQRDALRAAVVREQLL